MKKNTKKEKVEVVIVPTKINTRNGWVTSDDAFDVVVKGKDCSVKVYGMDKALETKTALETMFNK